MVRALCVSSEIIRSVLCQNRAKSTFCLCCLTTSGKREINIFCFLTQPSTQFALFANKWQHDAINLVFTSAPHQGSPVSSLFWYMGLYQQVCKIPFKFHKVSIYWISCSLKVLLSKSWLSVTPFFQLLVKCRFSGTASCLITKVTSEAQNKISRKHTFKARTTMNTGCA